MKKISLLFAISFLMYSLFLLTNLFIDFILEKSSIVLGISVFVYFSIVLLTVNSIINLVIQLFKK